ncbi:hypothetical protein [Pseudomonas fluorescens]|nr:hypothetical protein [Pseudomonas fluorescens]
MTRDNIRFLSEDQLAIWANAGKSMPRKQLDELMLQTPPTLVKDRNLDEFYEVRRIDVPTVFDSLLKLQNTGAARRHIETFQGEFREVLRIEVTLLDGIMLILGMVLGFILGMLSPGASGAGKPPSMANPVNDLSPENKIYVPTWKRQAQKIGYDGPSL